MPFEEGIKDERVDLSFMSTIELENLIKRRIQFFMSLERATHGGDHRLVPAINRIIELSKPEE